MTDTSPAAQTDKVHFLPRVVEFCRFLREQGFRVTPTHTSLAVAALRAVDIGDRQDFYLALRVVLVSAEPELARFDDLFRVFWEGNIGTRRQETTILEMEQAAVLSAEPAGTCSSFEVLAAKDFGDVLEDADRRALEDALRRIARKLATRRGRRMQPTRRGGRVDARRTIRRSLRLGGTTLELARRKPRVRKTRLVLLCDVSRSMDQYSRFLLQFVYAFQRALGRVESFVFGTRLTRVTRYFRTSSISEAIDRVSGEVLDWSGGTRIGASLEAFNRDYRATVDSSTTVVVLSDGLDTGGVDLLDGQMALLRHRVRRLIWLNPLLGSPEPALARGMRAALPYVDTFAPGHNLASLEALARAL